MGVAMVLAAAGVQAQLPTFYVDVNAPGPGTGTQINPFPTVQGGVNAAASAAFGTVVVSPGRYFENVVVPGPSAFGVTVFGSAGASRTIVDGGGVGPVFRVTTGVFGMGSGTCNLTGLTITNGQGTLASRSGGVHAPDGVTANLYGCIIEGNVGAVGGAGGIGGAVGGAYGTAPLLNNCIVRGNQGGDGNTGGVRGDAYCRNTLFANNTGGGGMIPGPGAALGGTSNFINCTFANNVGGAGAGGVQGAGAIQSSGVLTNCVLWGNTLPVSTAVTGPLFMVTSITQGGNVPGLTDPLFADPVNDDFHVLPLSPCIDGGTALMTVPVADFDGDARVGPPDIGFDEAFLRLVVDQPGGAGGPVRVQNHHLNFGDEIFNVYSTPCPGAPGSGPAGFLGLCTTNPALLAAQVLTPVGTFPFHYLATGTTSNLGQYGLPPQTIEALAIRVAGGAIVDTSAIVDFTVQ